MVKIVKSLKVNLVSPVALDDRLYEFLQSQATEASVSAGHILRQAIRILQEKPDTVYPDHKSQKPHRGPSFLLSDDEKVILDNLCAGQKRNMVIRNALWALLQSKVQVVVKEQ